MQDLIKEKKIFVMSKGLEIYACSGVDTPIQTEARRVAKAIDDAGWMRNETLRKYLGTSQDGGGAEYFLYIFIPDEDLDKYNSVIYQKRKQQLKTYAYVRELFVGHNYGTEEEMVEIIRKGIETTFDMPLDTILKGIRDGDKNAISGPITLAVAMIITAIISLVCSVILGVIQYCQNVKIAQYTAPTYQEVEDSAPAETDFLSNSKKKGVMYALLAGAAVFIISKLKRS